MPDSPAYESLKPSDVIVGVHTDSDSLTSESTLPSQDVSNFIANSNGSPVTLDVMRRNELTQVTVQPQKNVIADEPERYAAGFTLTLAGTERISFFPALMQGAERTVYSLVDVTYGLYMLLTGAFTGDANLSQVSGPVGIVGLVGDAAALGFTWLLVFSAFISLNLAVINLLPFPALDGGRLVFVFIESITKKPIKPSIARGLNMIGFIALLSLMFIVTVSDVAKLF
jgi:regulator of sigma E protease